MWIWGENSGTCILGSKKRWKASMALLPLVYYGLLQRQHKIGLKIPADLGLKESKHFSVWLFLVIFLVKTLHVGFILLWSLCTTFCPLKSLGRLNKNLKFKPSQNLWEGCIAQISTKLLEILFSAKRSPVYKFIGLPE